MSYRNWALTLNNYEDGDIAHFLNTYKHAVCLSMGEEVGEEGTPHLQAAISLKSESCFGAIKKKLGPRWHISCMASRSTPQQLHSYCMKGESEKWDPKNPKSVMWCHEKPGHNWKGEFLGKFPTGQGKDPGFADLCESIRNGKITTSEIMRRDPVCFHKYGRTLQACEEDYLQSQFRTWMTKGIWLTGRGGCGKSHAAFLNFNPEDSYVWKDDNGWQDGYKGQSTIILNDFRGSTMKFSQLMELVDKYPHEIRRRGKCPMPNLARTVIITSVTKPKEAYKNCLAELNNWEQFERRFEVMSSSNLAEDMILMSSLRLRK